MALQTELDFRGIPLKNAYIRVDRLYGGKQENSYGSVVGIYADQAAAEAKQPPLDQFNFTVPYVADEHPFTLLYAGLKADKYPDAVDA